MGNQSFKWGKESFDILSVSDTETTFIVTFLPGAAVPTHIHTISDEHFEMQKGQLSVILDGKKIELKEGEKITVKRKIPHSIKNHSNDIISFKVIYSPPSDTGKFLKIGAFLSSKNPNDKNLMMKQLYISKKMGYRNFSDMPNKALDIMANAALSVVFFFGSLSGWGKLVEQFKQSSERLQGSMRNAILIFALILTTLISYGQKKQQMKNPKITHMEDTVSINAPIDTVFAFITDFRIISKWHKNMKKVGWKNDGPHGVGSEYDWIESFSGMKMDLCGVITLWDAPNSFAWKPTNSPFKMTGGWTLVAKENSTLVTRYSDNGLSGIFKLLNSLFLPKAKRQVKSEFQELKRLIEAKNRV